MSIPDKTREHLIDLFLEAMSDPDMKEHQKTFNETATILINGRSPEQVKKMEIEQFGRALSNA